VSAEKVTEIADEVTAELQGRNEQIISSSTVGAAVAERLRDLDKVAYIRFVSVYKGYSDPEDFREVLDSVLADTDTTSSELSDQQI
jgi:Predicted transcriptional regulator, consists of a Zn-ribbon and ATP-cone domains